MTSSRGLQLGNMATVTDAERQQFESFYNSVFGHPHRGLEYFLTNAPESLKRYRAYANTANPRNYEYDNRAFVFSYLPYYALLGYDVGVRYVVHIRQQLGLTKAEVLEGIATAFLVMGPAGAETVARGLENYEWLEPIEPAQFPQGWEPDPGAFHSGLDFDDPDLSPGEERSLRAWYRETLGEIPGYVDLLIAHRPRMIKAYRSRFENCVKLLPKQFVPTTLLHQAVWAGNAASIRENLLLARAFGVQKDLALQSMGGASLYGVDLFSIVSEVGVDVLTNWGPR